MESREPLLGINPVYAPTSLVSEPFITPTARKSEKEHGAKSLFFCLVVESPFDLKEPESRVVDETLFNGESSTSASGAIESTFLSDEELLMSPKDQKKGGKEAPNKFQKIIEILLRFRKRGVTFLPEGMLQRVEEATGLDKDGAAGANSFHGYRLNKEQCLLSPDEDELYIKIHTSRKVLLAFAELQGLELNTHPYSHAGGHPKPYSAAADKILTESVELFYSVYSAQAVLKTEEDKEGVYLSGKKRYGFMLDVPDKMRLLVRSVREAWRFGGCGIQLAEMQRRGVLILKFFPLHNREYQKAYDLDTWASFKTMLSRPLMQDTDALVKYFGEEVALYFTWLRKYTLALRYIAVFGFTAGVLNLVTTHWPEVRSQIPQSIVNGVFSVLCVGWGAFWNFYWLTSESSFNAKYGQEAQIQQEMVRDEYEGTTDPITIPELFNMQFMYPLTLKTMPDGTMVDLAYPEWKRKAVRYLFSYPMILILTLGMVTALVFTTKWRFDNADNDVVNYLSSAITVIISFVFGLVFDKIIDFLNSLENNRTDTEENAQTISKSFLFYFFSYYFALFVMALWPSDITDAVRLNQIWSQMLIITLVKPMVQNMTELLMPQLNYQLRQRGDIAGGFCSGLCTLLCCKSLEQMELERNSTRPAMTELDVEGRALWEEAQLEPYISTSGDYLEIALQYGYMTMFAATFPWAAPAAFLYNILELRVDARKVLYLSQRPVAAPAMSIGPWNAIFFFLMALGVVTNGFLMSLLSPLPGRIGLPTDPETRYKVFTVVQYILIIVFYMAHGWFGTVSSTYCKIKAKHHILANKATRLRIQETLERESRMTKTQAPAV